MANSTTFVPSRYLFNCGCYKNSKISVQSCPPWGYFERLVIPIRNYKLLKKGWRTKYFLTFFFVLLLCHVTNTPMKKKMENNNWILHKKIETYKIFHFWSKSLRKTTITGKPFYGFQKFFVFQCPVTWPLHMHKKKLVSCFEIIRKGMKTKFRFW